MRRKKCKDVAISLSIWGDGMEAKSRRKKEERKKIVGNTGKRAIQQKKGVATHLFLFHSPHLFNRHNYFFVYIIYYGGTWSTGEEGGSVDPHLLRPRHGNSFSHSKTVPGCPATQPFLFSLQPLSAEIDLYIYITYIGIFHHVFSHAWPFSQRLTPPSSSKCAIMYGREVVTAVRWGRK